MKKFLKFIIPFLFLIAGAGILVAWAFYVEPNVNQEKVIVAKHDINFKGKIKKEDLLIKEVPKDNLVENAFSPNDINTIIGKNASVEINKGTQIYPNLVDTYDLIPNEKKGEFVAPIPNKWLFAVPGSLRRTYIADFYAIPDKDQAVINALIKESNNSNSDQQKSSDNNGQTQPVKTDEQSDFLVAQNSKPILENIIVSSVKDGSNKEVRETDKSKDDATGVIASMEIIANGETLSKMREYTDKGYKLYIVYKYER